MTFKDAFPTESPTVAERATAECEQQRGNDLPMIEFEAKCRRFEMYVAVRQAELELELALEAEQCVERVRLLAEKKARIHTARIRELESTKRLPH